MVSVYFISLVYFISYFIFLVYIPPLSCCVLTWKRGHFSLVFFSLAHGSYREDRILSKPNYLPKSSTINSYDFNIWKIGGRGGIGTEARHKHSVHSTTLIFWISAKCYHLWMLPWIQGQNWIAASPDMSRHVIVSLIWYLLHWHYIFSALESPSTPNINEFVTMSNFSI